MTLRRYLLLGGIALIIALLLDAPAATLYSWATRKGPPETVQLAGLSGSLDAGRMSALLINGQPVASDLDWSLHPLWLLAARLGFHLDGGGEQSHVSGDLSLMPGGRVNFGNVQMTTTVKALLAAAGYPLPWLDGEATLALSRLKLRNGLPRDAQGKVLLHGVTWGIGQAAPLGDFAADIARDGDAVVAKLSSVSGALELSGDARLLDDDSYEVKVQFRPRPDAPPAVQNAVRSTGTPDLQGYYHFDRHGKLGTPGA